MQSYGVCRFSWFLVSGCLLIFKFSFGFFIQLDDCLKVGCLLVIFLSYAKKEISEVAFFLLAKRHCICGANMVQQFLLMILLAFSHFSMLNAFEKTFPVMIPLNC